jgi:hypothetical protein
MQDLLLDSAAPDRMQSAEALLGSQSSEDASTTEPLSWPAAHALAADGGEPRTSGRHAEEPVQQEGRVAELEGTVKVRSLLLLRQLQPGNLLPCACGGSCMHVQVLREKVKKLEQLVRLKDAKIQALQARPEAPGMGASSSWGMGSWEQPPAA